MFPYAACDVPYLTTKQMIEVDRIMIEEYRIDLIQMMENAGRALAHVARTRFLNGDPRGSRLAILAGTGGNGGGALVAARRLHNYGADIHVFIVKPDDRFTPVPAHQLAILRHMGISVDLARDLVEEDGWDLIVDGMIGYSLRGAPRGAARELIGWANEQDAPILALDAPSGIDANTGTVFEPAIRAAATVTLALPKKGLLHDDVTPLVGELYLADISVPPELFAEPSLGLEVGPIFAAGDVVRLR